MSAPLTRAVRGWLERAVTLRLVSGSLRAWFGRWRRHPRVLAALVAAVPGALLGFQLTGLLFFLNHHIPLVGFTVLRASLCYGLPLALGSIVLVLPWLRSRSPERALPFLLAAAFVLAGSMSFLHASRLAFYLAPEVNRRLLRVALWLVLAAVIAFYTALAHAWRRRRYRARSRIGLLLLTLLSVYVVLERRHAARSVLAEPPRPTLVAPAERTSLVVVAVDALSFDALLPLAEQGSVPFLQESLRAGAAAARAAPSPVRHLPAWWSVATGKYPYLHGVLDDRVWSAPAFRRGLEFRLLPLLPGFEHWGAGAARPLVVNEGRRAASLWEIGRRLGVEAAVFGWPGAAGAPPTGGQTDQHHVAAALAYLASRPADQPAALFVGLPDLGRVAAASASGFSAVQFEGSQHPQHKADTRALAAAYLALDRSLRELWQALPPPRLLAVVSPYGTDAPTARGRLWQRVVPGATGAALAGDGVFLLRGNGVRAGERLRLAAATDVAPTVLYGLGLPVARDFSGRLLTEAFDRGHLARTPLTLVPSFENLPADVGIRR